MKKLKSATRHTVVKPIPKAGHAFEVHIPKAIACGGKVLMDGVELKGVKRVEFSAGIEEVSEITITFIADSLNKIEE